MLENAARTRSSGISLGILLSSQQSCVPFVGEERQDSFRLTPISDYIRDGTHAFELVEAQGFSKPGQQSKDLLVASPARM